MHHHSVLLREYPDRRSYKSLKFSLKNTIVYRKYCLEKIKIDVNILFAKLIRFNKLELICLIKVYCIKCTLYNN